MDHCDQTANHIEYRVEEAESSQSFGAIGAGFDSQDPDIGTRFV
jgi:hypothetical protein